MNQTNTDSASVETLLAEGTTDAAARLRELAETTTEKDTRKAARRALYLLSQKGVAPPELPAKSTPSVPAAKPPLVLTAWASAYDGAGNRLLFLAWLNSDSGSPTFLQALLNDAEGVRDMETRRLPRRELDERLQGFTSQLDSGIALAEIAPDYGRFLLHQAQTRSRQQRRMTPAGFIDLLNVIGEPQQDYTVSPVWERIREEEIRADTETYSAADLFKLPWFEAWFLDVNDVVPWMSDVYEVIGDENASEAAQQQGLQAVAATAVAELFHADLRMQYVCRLEETADVLLRREREPEARQALYHALRLRDSATAADSEFAVMLVQRTMQAAVEMMRQRMQG